MSGSVYWVLTLLLNFMEVSQNLFQEFNIIKSTALQFMLSIDDIVPEQCIKGSALAKRGQSDACCSLSVTLGIVDFVSTLPSASVFFTWSCNTAYPPPHPVQPRSFSFPVVRDVLHCALPFHHVDANEQARLWGTPVTVITSSDCFFWIRHSFMVLEILVHQVPIFSMSLDFIPCVKTSRRLYVLLIQKVIVDTLRS